jgi:hypothetical protein
MWASGRVHKLELKVKKPPRIASCHVSSLPLLSFAGLCRQALRFPKEHVGLGTIAEGLWGV